MTEDEMGQAFAIDWLRQELAGPAPADAEAAIELAGALGQVLDTGVHDPSAQGLVDAAQRRLAELPPSIRSNVVEALPDGSLPDDLAARIATAADPTEVQDWLLAVDEVARAARVLGLEARCRSAFDALARDIDVHSALYAPHALFAEQQSERGLGAHPERPLLRFWTALAMADLGASLLDEAEATDESVVQGMLAALTGARSGAVVLDLDAFRRRGAAAAESGGLRLAADSSFDLSELPVLEPIGGGDSWEAFLQLRALRVVVAIYGPDEDASIQLSGPGGDVAVIWRADHHEAAVDRDGEWRLTVGEAILRFRLASGG